MTLQQQLAVATDITAVFVDPAQRRAELKADIFATAAKGGGEIDPAAFQGRPTILRRLAALAADSLPSPLDRLITAPDGLALTTAVSLHTGVPYTVVRENCTLVGEIHKGERVAMIHPRLTTAEDALRTAEAALEQGADVTGVFVAIESDSGVTNVLVDAGFRLHVLLPDHPADQH